MTGGKDPRRVIQGLRSREQGRNFENQIEASFARLEEIGTASAAKTPEPVKILTQPDSRGQFKACFAKKAEPDFKGVMRGGRAIMFEAKSTTTGKLEQSIIKEEQVKKLDLYEQAGAHCFILGSFDGVRVYRIPWAIWKRMKELYGRKYITEEEAKPYGLPIGPGFTCLPLYGIPDPDSFNYGNTAPTLEDILVTFCGLPYGSDISGPAWEAAYSRLVNLVDAIGKLTETPVGAMIDRLDAIDSRDGEI